LIYGGGKNRKVKMPQGGHNKGKGQNLIWLKDRISYDSDECLIWPFSINHQGYGQIGYYGKVRKAHRVMCELAKGPPPSPKHEAAHECGNGHLGCVNPKHLNWKTPAGNRADTIRHGTWAKKVKRRLTIDQVEEIKLNPSSCVVLAEQYNVSVSSIFKIRRGETWSTPRSKLTLEKIRTIREAPEDQAIAIGKALGVNSTKVWKLRSGETFQGIE
jgi:hypothetical protein